MKMVTLFKKALYVIALSSMILMATVPAFADPDPIPLPGDLTPPPGGLKSGTQDFDLDMAKYIAGINT